MENNSFSIKVNGNYSFTEEEVADVDFIPTGPDSFHILYKNTSFHARLVSLDKEAKTMHIRVDGTPQEVKLLDAYDKLVEKLGLTTKASNVLKKVLAPMPGMVLEVNVEVGQEVKEGDPLLILEAMKMENVLKASGEGKVKAVIAKQGKPVEKNELLIEFE